MIINVMIRQNILIFDATTYNLILWNKRWSSRIYLLLI